MAVAWSELRGVHGHSGHVEPGPEWLLEHFRIDPWGAGLDLAVTGHPEGPVGAPSLWVHLTIASPLERRLPASAAAVVANPVKLRHVTAFYRTNQGARLTHVDVWDGGRRIKQVTTNHGSNQDFSAKAEQRNTWTVDRALGIGLGVSLRFAFDTALGGEGFIPGEVRVTGVRALFERQSPS